MGVIRWLDRIEPKTWKETTERIQKDGDSLQDSDKARDFLREYGKEVDEYLYEYAGSEDEDESRFFLNSVLEEAVTAERWEMDKAFNLFGDACKLVPLAEPLMKIIDFKGLDVDLPDNARCMDSGFYGCCSASSIADCVAVFETFPSAEDLVDAAREAKGGWFANLSGRNRRVDAVLKSWREDYQSEIWPDFATAVRSTVEKGHYLGLGMSV